MKVPCISGPLQRNNNCNKVKPKVFISSACYPVTADFLEVCQRMIYSLNCSSQYSFIIINVAVIPSGGVRGVGQNIGGIGPLVDTGQQQGCMTRLVGHGWKS